MEKKQLYSDKLQLGKRTYFFDVKESVNGSKYLVLGESHPAGDKFEQSRVMVFENDFVKFHSGLQKAFEFIKTA